MMSHVAGCSTLVHHESRQPTADEHVARNHLEEAYTQSYEYISDRVLHGNAALSDVYGLVMCMAKAMLLAWGN